MGRVFQIDFRQRTEGSISVMTGLISLGLIGVVGLSVETGYWYHLQEKAQMAADVSAFAGAVALRNGEDVATAKAQAIKEAEELGYTSINLATVTPVSPPRQGGYQSDRDIEVSINYNAPRLFSSIFLNTQLFHDVRSVAGYSPSVDVCILAYVECQTAHNQNQATQQKYHAGEPVCQRERWMISKLETNARERYLQS